VQLLVELSSVADGQFNQALAAWKSGDAARALEHLEANAALVIADVDARVLQAYALAERGRWEEVGDLVSLIEGLDPERIELVALRNGFLEVNRQTEEKS